MSELLTDMRGQAMLHEYDAIQSKIKYSVEDLARTETIIPVAMAAFYAWIAKDGSSVVDGNPWILVLPCFLGILGFLRHRARYGYIRIVEDYARQLELELFGPQVADQPIRGYERYYSVNNRGTHKWLRTIFWLAIIVGSFVLATGKIAAIKFHC